MEATFTSTNQNQAKSGAEVEARDAERQAQNAQRAAQGEPTVGGSAGRAQVAEGNNPEAHDMKRGGPGSMGNKPVQDPTI